VVANVVWHSFLTHRVTMTRYHKSLEIKMWCWRTNFRLHRKHA